MFCLLGQRTVPGLLLVGALQADGLVEHGLAFLGEHGVADVVAIAEELEAVTGLGVLQGRLGLGGFLSCLLSGSKLKKFGFSGSGSAR